MEDAAAGLIAGAENYDGADPVNLGSGEEISILKLTKLIARLCEYRGRIEWDTSKPNGQPRRLLDTSRARREFGFEASTRLQDGLHRTINWYRSESRIPG